MRITPPCSSIFLVQDNGRERSFFSFPTPIPTYILFSDSDPPSSPVPDGDSLDFSLLELEREKSRQKSENRAQEYLARSKPGSLGSAWGLRCQGPAIDDEWPCQATEYFKWGDYYGLRIVAHL